MQGADQSAMPLAPRYGIVPGANGLSAGAATGRRAVEPAEGGDIERKSTSTPDPAVERLAELFRSHPAWIAAARSIADEATSRVFFAHRPGEPWRLERHRGETRLVPGAVADPDFCFRFPPGAIERLAAVRGGVGEFAVELFELIGEADPALRVDFRIAAPFERLARRGYLGLLLRGGPRVLAFGATRGVRTLAALRRLVAGMVGRAPEPWETEGRPAPPRGA
jgi:hypothetical protein